MFALRAAKQEEMKFIAQRTSLLTVNIKVGLYARKTDDEVEDVRSSQALSYHSDGKSFPCPCRKMLG